jgi:hypothetical protein
MTRRGHESDAIELVLRVIRTMHQAMTHHRSYQIPLHRRRRLSGNRRLTGSTLRVPRLREGKLFGRPRSLSSGRAAHGPGGGLLRMRVFLVLSKDYLMLRSARGRVSKHAPPRCSSASAALNQFPDRLESRCPRQKWIPPSRLSGNPDSEPQVSHSVVPAQAGTQGFQ